MEPNRPSTPKLPKNRASSSVNISAIQIDRLSSVHRRRFLKTVGGATTAAVIGLKTSTLEAQDTQGGVSASAPDEPEWEYALEYEFNLVAPMCPDQATETATATIDASENFWPGGDETVITIEIERVEGPEDSKEIDPSEYNDVPQDKLLSFGVDLKIKGIVKENAWQDSDVDYEAEAQVQCGSTGTIVTEEPYVNQPGVLPEEKKPEITTSPNDPGGSSEQSQDVAVSAEWKEYGWDVFGTYADSSGWSFNWGGSGSSKRTRKKKEAEADGTGGLGWTPVPNVSMTDATMVWDFNIAKRWRQLRREKGSGPTSWQPDPTGGGWSKWKVDTSDSEEE